MTEQSSSSFFLYSNNENNIIPSARKLYQITLKNQKEEFDTWHKAVEKTIASYLLDTANKKPSISNYCCSIKYEDLSNPMTKIPTGKGELYAKFLQDMYKDYKIKYYQTYGNKGDEMLFDWSPENFKSELTNMSFSDVKKKEESKISTSGFGAGFGFFR